MNRYLGDDWYLPVPSRAQFENEIFEGLCARGLPRNSSTVRELTRALGQIHWPRVVEMWVTVTPLLEMFDAAMVATDPARATGEDLDAFVALTATR